jgi:hypothetical protein
MPAIPSVSHFEEFMTQQIFVTQENEPLWRRFIVPICALIGMIFFFVGDYYFEIKGEEVQSAFAGGAGGALIGLLIKKIVPNRAAKPTTRN